MAAPNASDETDLSAVTITGFSVWNLIETQVGIIAGCSMLLRPVLLDIVSGDSLTNLLQSMRHRMSGTRQSGEKGFREQHSNENMMPLASDEQLIRTFDPVNKSRAEAVTDHIELESAKQHGPSLGVDEIRVGKHVTVEHT